MDEMATCQTCENNENYFEEDDLEDDYSDENAYKEIHLKLTPEVKTELKNYIRVNSRQIHADFIYVPPRYEEHHIKIKNLIRPLLKQFEIKVPKGSHKPTDFAITLLLAMDDTTIDEVDENLIGFHRNQHFNDLNEFYEEDSTYTCGCGRKHIRNVFELENRKTGIRIYTGEECIKKYKLLTSEIIKKGKKNIELQKKYNSCKKCKKYCIPKDSEKTICDNCVTYFHNCKKCKEEYFSPYKNPTERICDKCQRKLNKKKDKQIKNKDDYYYATKTSLSVLDVEDKIEFNEFMLVKKNNEEYKYVIKNINDDNKFYYANQQLIDILSNIDKDKEEYKKIITLHNQIYKITNKRLNKYNAYTVKLELI
jgi:hypothetical protein